MHTPLARVLFAVALPLCVAACGGGGGGGGGSSGGGGPVAPDVTATIVFPPTGFLTDAQTVVVLGTAADPDGVQSIAVNGLVASSGNGFAEWEISLPTPLGDSPVVVSAVDNLGHATPNAASLSVARNQGPLIGRVSQLGFNPATDQIIVYDDGIQALFSVDPDAHTGQLLSSATLGSGPPVSACYELSLAPSLGTAYVSTASSVMSINLATGARAFVTGNGVGGGPALQSAYRVAVNGAAGVGYVGDNVATKIFQFSLATGDRTLLSGGGAGAGPAFGTIGYTALDAAGGRLFVLTGSPIDRVYAVDVTTGDRTLISGDGVGAGPDVGNPLGMQWDAANSRVVVSNGDARMLLSIDPATGDRTAFASQVVGTVPAGYENGSSFKYGLALDPARGVAWVSPSDFASIVAVEFATGDWTEIYRPTVGTGPILANIRSAVFDPTTRRELVFCYGHWELVAVDTATGARSFFTGPGPNLKNADGIAIDAAHGRALVGCYGATPNIVAVDLATGARTLVSGSGVGAGPIPQKVYRATVDAAGTTLYTADPLLQAVFAFDLQTGDRQIVADAANGSGPLLTSAGTLAIDAASGTLYVSDDEQSGRILAIHLATGVRTVVSGAGVGSGPGIDFVGAMTFDPATHRLFVAQNRSILAIDVATGARTTIASWTVGAGPKLDSYMTSIDVDPETGLLFVTEQLPCRLLVIDPATGDRVVVSK